MKVNIELKSVLVFEFGIKNILPKKTSKNIA